MNTSMGLDQLQMAPLVLDASLLHLFTRQEVFMMHQRHLSSGISGAIWRDVYI